ncbi:MAG: hypothetical protein ABIK83_02570 [Candidatus Zixiibacteriota bacterium]
MSDCANSDTGKLLHGYEIGILSEKECEAFEIHLLKCRNCHDQLQAFEESAIHLTTSDRIRAFVDKTLSQQQSAESLSGRIWRFLWPDAPLITKPAVAYLVILLLIVPAYLGINRSDISIVSEFEQTVHLTPTRTSPQTLNKSMGNIALLTFRFDDYQHGLTYIITIESDDGTVVFVNNEFASFDARGIGYLSLTLQDMKSGRYHLAIVGTRQDSRRVFQRYLFTVDD